MIPGLASGNRKGRNRMSSSELDWLKSRQGGVGSSDSPILALGEVFKKTSVDLYIDKKKTITADDVGIDYAPFRRGHTYEPLALALYEQQYGVKVYYPKTDDERYNQFQVWDPKHSFLFADFDGLCEDMWVAEVKSPMQRVADQIKASGLKDYYQIQAQHLAHHANVCTLPVVGDKWKGKAKGTRVIVYEPENVAVQVYELPIEKKMVKAIIANAKHFWMNHVEAGVPPMDSQPKQPVKKKAKGGKYTQVEGAGWEEAVSRFKLAQERKVAAEKMLATAKHLIIDTMGKLKMDAVQVGQFKFSHKEQAGRSSLDVKALRAALAEIEVKCPGCSHTFKHNPEIDTEDFKKQGAPFMTFRNYGPKSDLKDAEQTDDSSLDEQLLGLVDELNVFSTRDLDPDHAVTVFDELRERAELYTRVLNMETEQIMEALQIAGEAVTRMVTKK